MRVLLYIANEYFLKKMNSLSPKSEFLKDSKQADAFMEFALSPLFHRAASAALAEYANNLDSRDPTSAPALGGARGFLRVLMNIGEPSAPGGLPEVRGKLDAI
jgi:hypothetical protein